MVKEKRKRRDVMETWGRVQKANEALTAIEVQTGSEEIETLASEALQTLGAIDHAEDDVQTAQKKQKKPPVLPWMRVPIAIGAWEGRLIEDVRGLDPSLMKTLQSDMGIESLFPVQLAAWNVTCGGTVKKHDICIAAPTGSGKTLSYVLPIAQALSQRKAHGLHALAVLPTRDLAAQVFSVFQQVCPSLMLKCALLCGRESLVSEALTLSPSLGVIDIVVATPGRLIAHLEGTPGFNLDALDYMVIDETDRMLRQAYQSWLPKVLDRVRSRTVLKFVVSATLTRDPSKIDRLELVYPRYIAMSSEDHRYSLPRSLKEFKVVMAESLKPHGLVALLQQLKGQKTVIFAGSLQAAHALTLFLQAAMPNDLVIEFSSLLNVSQRASALSEFSDSAGIDTTPVLVASDAMTRGIDVPSIAVVINYDAPVYVKTYVHRAGRTARAGASGQVFTFLKMEDVRHFKGMLRKADNSFVKDYKLGQEELSAVKGVVDRALIKMTENASPSSAKSIDTPSSAQKNAKKRASATKCPISGLKDFSLLKIQLQTQL